MFSTADSHYIIKMYKEAYKPPLLFCGVLLLLGLK